MNSEMQERYELAWLKKEALNRSTMDGYYCIVETGRIPICGFSSKESAEKHKIERGISGEIQYFNCRTLEYSEVKP